MRHAPQRWACTCARPSTSWTSSSCSGTSTSGGSPSRSRRCSTLAASRAASAASSCADDATRRASASPSASGELRGQLAVDRRRDVDAVHHEPGERQPAVAQLAMEVDRLLDRVVARGGDDQERRARVGEQRADALGAGDEAVDHPAERAEEDREVLEQVDAGDAPQQPERDARPAADDPAAEPGGAEEHLDRAALEEAGQPLRRVEEVERVARRRGVEHDQVEVAARVEVVELGDRGELLRPGHRARELLVDPVAEDVVAGPRVGREVLDQLVEGALRVEHERPQLAAHVDAVGAEALRVDQARLVAELLQAERGREPARGIDGHHGDLLARGGGAHRERGGGGRLAHAAGAGADDDPAAGDQLLDRGQISPSRTACATACERERALSFVTTSCSTFFTVRSE